MTLILGFILAYLFVGINFAVVCWRLDGELRVPRIAYLVLLWPAIVYGPDLEGL